MDWPDRIKRMGRLLKAIRLERGLTVEQVAVKMGYSRKMAKGVRRIEQGEAGTEATTFLDRIAKALGEDLDAIERAAIAQDCAQREEWFAGWLARQEADPPPTQIKIRAMASIYCRHDIPEGSAKTLAEAVAFARQFAKEHKLMVCLLLSNGTSAAYFDVDGAFVSMGGVPTGAYFR